MVGLSRQINNPTTGWYAVVGGPKSKIDINSLKVDPDDFKLLTSSGEAFTDFPYFVFSIDNHKTLDTWYDLPEMMDAWDAIKKAVRDNDRKEAAASLGSFRRIQARNELGKVTGYFGHFFVGNRILVGESTDRPSAERRTTFC